MLIVTTKRFKKQYVIGGAGVFDTVVNFFRKLFTSDAAKQLASVALSAGKAATKEVGKKAIDIDKTGAFDAGKTID